MKPKKANGKKAKISKRPSKKKVEKPVKCYKCSKLTKKVYLSGGKSVNDKLAKCEDCRHHFHHSCENIQGLELDAIAEWFCSKCYKEADDRLYPGKPKPQHSKCNISNGSLSFSFFYSFD